MSSATSSIGGMISKISGIAALAATGFGLGTLIEGAVTAGNNVYLLSQKMNIGTAEASQLSRVLKLTGADTGTFASSMMRLDKSYSATGDAGDKTRATLEAFGVSLADGNGKLLPLNQQLDQMSKGYKRASASGQQEEFIMETIGARGLSLVGTFMNLAEAKEDAAKVSGIGMDPKQMRDLKREMDVVALQAGQIGMAFTSALAPVATEIFPPIMSSLQSVAIFLKDNKDSVLGLTETVVKLAVAYEAIKLASAAGVAANSMWSTITAACVTSTTTQMESSTALTAWQQKDIAQRVALNNKSYIKMSADAQKSAMTMGLSSEETTALITANCTRIATVSAETAASIRASFTASYLAQNAEALKSAAIVNEAQASTAIVAAEAAATKTAVTTTSAEMCAATVVGSSITQVTAIESTGAAAIVASETTVGAMAIAGTAVTGLTRLVFTLIGGWVGVATAIGYAIYKLDQWADAKYRMDGYNKDAEVRKITTDDGSFTQYQVKRQKMVGPIPVQSWENMTDAERDDQIAFENREKPKPTPQTDMPPVVIPTTPEKEKKSKSGKTDEEKAAEKAEKAYEELQKKAKATSDSIRDEWITLTGTQLDALDNWRNKEQADLDSSASANADYVLDKGRLDEIYAAKKKKILETQQKDSNAIWDKAFEDAKAYQDSISKFGKGEGTKQVIDIKSNAEAEFIKIKNAARDMEENYLSVTDEIKLQSIEAWTANGKQFTITKDGIKVDAEELATSVIAGTANMSNTQVSMAQDTANKIVAIKQDVVTKLNAINQFQLDYEGALKTARDQGDLAAYKMALSSQDGALTKSLTDRQLIIDNYNEAWKASHKSTTEYIMEGINGMASGLTTFFTDAISGTASIGDAWNALGSTVNKMISGMVADWIVGRIKMWAIEKIFGGKGTAIAGESAAQGAATAAAWWPAAVAVSLATFGANAGPAIGGMAAATIVGMGLGSVAGHATGGLINGAGTGTSDSILARLSHGEFVFTAATTNAIGADTLNSINATGKLPGYATGGLVTGRSLASMSGSYDRASNVAHERQSNNNATGGSGEGVTHVHHYNIQAWDRKSVAQWLEGAGGKIFERHALKQARQFVPVGG